MSKAENGSGGPARQFWADRIHKQACNGKFGLQAAESSAQDGNESSQTWIRLADNVD